MAQSRHRTGPPGPRFPVWLEAVLTPALLVALTALYLLSLHLSLDVMGEQVADDVTETRDGWYFGLHLAWAVAGTLIGTLVGIGFRRSAFAFASLFLAWMVVAMGAAQVATFELACEGHNDIIRHWHC